ncbi:MAG: biopolymer transporter ExbD [Verrucomicrobia bacterium]|jgi:biopolymer transport protein ExbD|nr:biopolymer transporter ExbD [Verrucomicrobiota bacterium]MBT7065062.1 biopolymer transporter ExbD [Verrucomicrobiota bacterium]MBT7699589.1 biopolymer transporter ExbD [Verrucomicrobiota bacterium]
MRIRKPQEGDAGVINMSSLLDVMFILIIFFLATTTFQQDERDIKVNLPESAEGQALSSAAKVIVINVRADGTYVMASQEIAVEAMQTALFNAIQADPQQKVLIRGDRQALHGHVAIAVSLCKRAGVHEANLGYQLPR